jgi:hypothetical protein
MLSTIEMPTLKMNQIAESWLTGREYRTRWLPVAAITALGIVLRLWSPKFGEDLWYDETFSLMNARLPFGEMTHRLMLLGETSPPLYTVLLHFWIKLGTSDAHVKLFSVLFGVASIWAIYLLARRVGNSLAALVSCLLLSVSESAIYYSIEARPYALFLLLSLLSTYSFLCALNEPRAKRRFGSKTIWAGYIVVTAMAVYTHWFGLLLPAVHAVGLAIYRPAFFRVRHFTLSLAIVGCLCLPLAPFLINQIKLQETIGGFRWPGRPGPRALLDLALFTTGGHGLLVLTFALLIVALFRMKSQPWDKKMKKSMVFVSAYVLLPIIIAYAVSSITARYSFFVFRYFLPFVAGVYILIGVTLSTLGKRTAIAFFAAFALIAILSIVRHREAPQNSYSRLAAETCTEGDAGVLVAHLSPMSYFPSLHYRRCNVNEKMLWIEQAQGGHVIGPHLGDQMIDPVDLEDVGEAMKQYREVWLVIDPGDIGRATRAVWRTVRENNDFSLGSQEQFGKLILERYRKKPIPAY